MEHSGGQRERFFYGSHPEQFILVSRPQVEAGTMFARLAILVHGGFWKQKYSVDNALTGDVATTLVKRGWHVADVEYRRVGHEGGGWPGSNDDVLAALNYIDASLEAIVHSSCTLLVSAIFGHSAGGQLAMWGAHKAHQIASARCNPSKPDLARGSSNLELCEPTRIALNPPDLVVAIAPVCDLVEAARARLSDEGDAVQRYLGGDPAQDAAAMHAARQASPVDACIPCLVTTLLVTGSLDVDVPSELVLRYARADTEADAKVIPMVIADGDHYSVFDGTSAACMAMIERAESLLWESAEKKQARQPS